MKSFGLPKYMVNTINLGLFVTDRIFFHKGLGPAVDMTISYNSLPNAAGMFGNKWIFKYESLIAEDKGSVNVIKASGQEISFETPESGTWPREAHAPGGCYDRLHDHGNYWLFYSKDSQLQFRYEKESLNGICRLAAIIDRNGNALKIEHGSEGKIAKITDAVGRGIEFKYHDRGFCRSFTLQDGRTALFDYDHFGNLIKTTDLAGILTQYQYDSEGYLIKMSVGRKSRTTHFSYQNRGNFNTIAAVMNPLGQRKTYELTSLDPRIVKVTFPEGNTTLYQSKNGQTERITDALGDFSSTQYDNGKPVLYRDKRGNETTYDYDTRGNLIRVKYPQDRLYQFVYDQEDHLIKEIDPLSQVITYTYDNKGNLVKIIYPSQRTLIYNFNERGQPFEILDSGNRKVSLTYDHYGNLVGTENNEGVKVSHAYDEFGYRIIAMANNEDNTYRYAYDANDRVTSFTNPDGSSVKMAYDCCSGIQTMDEIGNKISFERDSLSNVTCLIDEMGSDTQYIYNENNWLTKIVDPINRVISFSHNPIGLVTMTEDYLGNKHCFEYDEEGNLISFTDPLEKKIQYEYNSNNEVIRITNFMGTSIRCHRDKVGRAAAFVNARGNQISFSYDTEGRIIEKKFDQNVMAVRSFDDVNHTETIEDERGVTRTRYNHNLLPTEVVYPNKTRAAFSYDTLANIQKMTYGDDLTVEYTYDNRDRLTGIQWDEQSIRLSYDAASSLLNESRSNGTETDYLVNAKRMIMALNHRKQGEIFAGVLVERDLVDRIKKADIIHPLALPEALPSYRRAIEMNYAGKTVSVDGNNYVFDPDGNLTSGRNWEAVYDFENRPIEISYNGWKKRYGYDYYGYRSTEEIENNRIDFHFDPWGRLLYETDMKGNILASYIYGGKRLLAKIDRKKSVYFYHFDAMGNTFAITGGAGDVVNAYDYDPYGQIRTSLGETVNNRFTFGGSYGVIDEGQGLYAYKRRYYHSALGMFIQKDPIGLAGGGKDYAFAAGNPLLYIDLEGTFVSVLTILTIISVGFGVGTAYYLGTKADAAMEQGIEAAKIRSHYIKNINELSKRQNENDIINRILNLDKENIESFGIAVKSAGEAAKEIGKTLFDNYTPPVIGVARTAAEEALDHSGDIADERSPSQTAPGQSTPSRMDPGRDPCGPPGRVNLPEKLDWDSISNHD